MVRTLLVLSLLVGALASGELEPRLETSPSECLQGIVFALSMALSGLFTLTTVSLFSEGLSILTSALTEALPHALTSCFGLEELDQLN